MEARYHHASALTSVCDRNGKLKLAYSHLTSHPHSYGFVSSSSLLNVRERAMPEELAKSTR